MNRIIHRIVDEVVTHLKNNPHVEGIVSYGSYARNELDYYSDIDLIIYISDNAERKDIIEAVIEAIRVVDDIFMMFEKHGKLILYTTKYFIKLEIIIKKVSEISEEDVIFIRESRVRNVDDAILFDKTGVIKRVYEDLWSGLEDNLYEKTKYHIFSFLYYYDNFLVHFSRGDIYRAYMNYTIAFYHLASVLAVAHGEYRNIYQPWFLTRDILRGDELKDFYEASSSINPIDMFYSKEKMLMLFLRAVKKIEQHFNLGLTKQVEFFIKKSREKYPPFYNFRDVSKIVNICSKKVKLRSGLIFRSASLSRYKSETILNFLKEYNIKYIVDLRTEEDILTYEKPKGRGYSTEILQNYVVRIPISSRVKSYVEHPYKNLYYAILKESKNAIKKLFEEYIANVDESHIIIHCEGGKDRTGIIIALLLDILGVERECIIKDYLASYSDTKREYIEFLFSVLDNEYGGTERYLIDYCGVSRETIEKIRRIMVI